MNSSTSNFYCVYCSYKALAREKETYNTYRPDGFEYYECPACGAFNLKDLHHHYKESIYPVDYYTKQNLKKPLTYLQRKWAEDSFGLPTILGKLCSWVMGTRYSTLFYFQNYIQNKDSRILDFGCGNGHLLKSLKHLGYYKLYGMDPMTIPEHGYIGPEAMYSQDLPQITGLYDAIISCHSIEHIPQPDIMLSILHSRLTEGGYLIIQCPVTPNILINIYGSSWVGWDAPRHLTIPSEEALDNILVKKLKMEKIFVRYSESTLWNHQASYDKSASKFKNFLGRFSPSPIARILRERNKLTEESLYSDCKGFVYRKRHYPEIVP